MTQYYELVYANILLDVLDQEGGAPKVINREVEESLNLFDEEVNGDEVSHASLGEH